MTDSWESICVVKQMKGKTKQKPRVSVFQIANSSEKLKWGKVRVTIKVIERHVGHPAVEYELDKGGENRMNNIH